MIKVILNINKTRDSIKFNKDLWYINDDDISLLEIQEAADKMIKIMSLPLLRLGQRHCKHNSKNATHRHAFNTNHPLLPRLSLSISIITLYPTFPFYPVHLTLPHLSLTTQPMQLFQTRPVISCPFHPTRPIPL